MWWKPDDPTPREACPCCGYVTLAERGMSMLCRVCAWEDEVGDALDVFSTCNRMTLRVARRNFAADGLSHDGKQYDYTVNRGDRSAIERRALSEIDPRPPREVCPCCDYVSLPERGGGMICPICVWTDEGDELHAHARLAGTTLAIAREVFANGRTSPHALPIEERARFEHRSRDWCEPWPSIACPCCDHSTLTKRAADQSCVICGWIDDGSTIDVLSLTNRGSLASARTSFLAIGACDATTKEHVGLLSPDEYGRFRR